MKKMTMLAIAILLFSCKKDIQPTVWNCNINNLQVKVVSDTMPIIKTVNEFGNLVVCNCSLVK